MIERLGYSTEAAKANLEKSARQAEPLARVVKALHYSEICPCLCHMKPWDEGVIFRGCAVCGGESRDDR